MRPIFNLLAALFLVVAFVATAVGTILKTAGYTYNLKKGAFEQTGMLVVKTNPSDARVLLNGKTLHDSTPLRIRSLIPNRYDLELQKPGYRSWAAPVPVASNRVTFVQTVDLFPDAAVETVASGTIRTAALSTDGRLIAWTTDGNDGLRIMLTNTQNAATALAATIATATPRAALALAWSPRANHLLVVVTEPRATARATVLLLPPAGPRVDLDAITGTPILRARWAIDDPGLIEVVTGNALELIDPISRRILRAESIPRNAREAVFLNNLLVPFPRSREVAPGPSKNGWVPLLDPTRKRAGIIASRDINALVPTTITEGQFTVEATSLAWSPETDDDLILSVSAIEVAVLAPQRAGAQTTIAETALYRSGNGIDAATWSARGTTVFVASGGIVRAIDVADYGYGRVITDIGRLDRVTGLFAPRDGAALYIVGTYKNQDGIFRQPLK